MAPPDSVRGVNRLSCPSVPEERLGTFTHPITLYSPVGDRMETVEAMVDTGSTFTVVPGFILNALGVRPRRAVNLKLANGQVVERRVGTVTAEIDGEQESIICVFGDAEATPLIGAVTLESFLLAVDPVGQRLVPTEGYWLGGA